MPDELRRLLNSHEFFQQAISDYRSAMSREHLENLCSDRDRVFDEIVKLTSSQPSVTVAQINFLLASLAELAGNQSEAERLRNSCAAKVDLLAKSIAGQGAVYHGRASAGSFAEQVAPIDHIVSPSNTRLLDNITDRAAICDRNYRYIYTNMANARFHRMLPAEFVGQTAASIVGRKIFDRLTTPILDRCFSGESVSLTVAFQSEGKSTTFAARCEPIRDASGKVVASMLISRDVSNLAVKPDSLWRLPKVARRKA